MEGLVTLDHVDILEYVIVKRWILNKIQS